MCFFSQTITLRIVLQLLDEIILYDDQPVVEARALPLVCNTDFDTNFEDRSAFITGISKYMEEAARHKEFVSSFGFLLKHIGLE